MEIKPEDELNNIVLFPVKEDDLVIRLIFFMSHRKDHIVITPLSGLTKKSVRSAVKSAVQLWNHLTGCSLWRKRETRLADDVRLLRQEERERRKI